MRDQFLTFFRVKLPHGTLEVRFTGDADVAAFTAAIRMLTVQREILAEDEPKHRLRAGEDTPDAS